MLCLSNTASLSESEITVVDETADDVVEVAEELSLEELLELEEDSAEEVLLVIVDDVVGYGIDDDVDEDVDEDVDVGYGIDDDEPCVLDEPEEVSMVMIVGVQEEEERSEDCTTFI